MFKKIAIIGVGLIGGSIGMIARQKRLAGEIIGIGRRIVSLRKAIRKGAIASGTLDIREGVRGADLIIIATPGDKVMAKIKEAARYARRGAIIIDVNSTKEAVVKYAERIMAGDIYFVGTHPMAGLERAGVLFASTKLFKGTVCIVTPTPRTDKRALAKIRDFWEKMGARVEILSPRTHDRLIADISHLPHALAYNLCDTVSSEELKFAGPGFKDTTRIAKSNPEMWAEVFLQNSKNLIRAVENFEKNLKVLKSHIRRKSKKALLRRLKSAKKRRDKIG